MEDKHPGPTLVGLDAGTTGVTAVLFDRDLRSLARAYREFPQHFPAPGRVEHHAPELLAAVDEVLAELTRTDQASELAAIGLTNQRETVFALEPGSGEALAPGIVWQDRRTAERCRELEAAGELERVRAKTGLLLDPYFSGTKIEWLRQSLKPSRRVAFATVDALVLCHLTGTFATDPTNASRTMLFDIDGRGWDPELCGLFGVTPEELPEVRPSAGNFGSWRCSALGRDIPVLGVAGDQQAALFGQGAWEAGGLKCTFGTGCFLVLNHGELRPPDSTGGLLTTLVLGPGGSPAYGIEGSVFMAGAVIQWLRDQLGILSSADESEPVAASVEDAGGVRLVPAFTGLGAPHWDPDARAAILGLSRGSGRAHIVRAALEAIALQNAELVELLRGEVQTPIEAMLVDGGAAANDLLMQLQADFAGLVVQRPPAVEATARGAAALAGLASGLVVGKPAALTAEGDRFVGALGAGARAERLDRWARDVESVRAGR
ncbi:MAG: FGGY family carbohydrate kinase [Planctomycetota bacterium]|nr:FGGY family carbohydrate kinase [Planctomycetota bacterium]